MALAEGEWYPANLLVELSQCASNDIASVSNGSNALERFRVRVGTGIELLQRFLPYENPDSCNWAGFTTKNPTFQPRNFGSN
jgi:hypothetical protein